MTDTTPPAVWVDGDPLMEAIAAAVWERCTRDDEDMPQLVLDDPRNIAAVAAAVARTLPVPVVVPAADRAALRDRIAEARPTAAPTTPVTVTEYGFQAAGEPLVYSIGATTHVAAEEAATGHGMRLVQRTVTTTPWKDSTTAGAATSEREEPRQRIAAAMREHYLSSNRDEADADGNLPCRCGDWREPGLQGGDEDDWDAHLADVVLSVLPAPADRAAEARVRALHQQYRFAGDDSTDYCSHCNQISGGWIPWPCPTIRALDGVESAAVDRVAEATPVGAPDTGANGTGAPVAASDRAAEELAKHVTRAIFALKSPAPPGSEHYRAGWDDGLEAAMDAARDAVDRVAAETPPAETDALTPRCDHCRQPGHSFEDCPHADHGPAVEAQPGKDTETPQPKEA